MPRPPKTLTNGVVNICHFTPGKEPGIHVWNPAIGDGPSVVYLPIAHGVARGDGESDTRFTQSCIWATEGEQIDAAFEAANLLKVKRQVGPGVGLTIRRN